MAALSISVALATYNGEKFIREQLQSLADQTLLPSEVVITDDRSTDRTLEVAEQFARNAPFAVRIHQNADKLGFAENFFKAASLCKGDLIAFCDQDDRWLPHKLGACSQPFVDPEVLVCVHTSRLWYGGTEFGGYVPRFTERKVAQPASVDPLANYLGFSNVIRASVLTLIDYSARPRHPNIVKSVSAVHHPMVHDQWIWYVGSIFGKVAFIPEVQVFYRQHRGNTVGWTFADAPARERLATDKAGQFADQEQVALECAGFIERIAAPLPGALRANAARAAAAMRARAHVYELRKQIYLPKSRLPSRAGAFIELCRERGYGSPARGFSFGSKALFKDLIVGVPGAAGFFRRVAGV